MKRRAVRQVRITAMRKRRLGLDPCTGSRYRGVSTEEVRHRPAAAPRRGCGSVAAAVPPPTKDLPKETSSRRFWKVSSRIPVPFGWGRVRRLQSPALSSRRVPAHEKTCCPSGPNHGDAQKTPGSRPMHRFPVSRGVNRRGTAPPGSCTATRVRIGRRRCLPPPTKGQNNRQMTLLLDGLRSICQLTLRPVPRPVNVPEGAKPPVAGLFEPRLERALGVVSLYGSALGLERRG